MKVTRADVARAAHVSPALVSYVLNDGPRKVSPDARARIERAIAELGYRPNAIAQALRGGATRTVALLTPSPTNPFFAELAQAIEAELFTQGNTLAVGVTDDDPEREERYLTSFLDRQVDGLMLITTHAAQTLTHLAESGSSAPALVLDRLPPASEAALRYSSVRVDNARGGRRAVSHLLEHGHRLIGCVAGSSGMPLTDQRVEAWRDLLACAGLPRDDALVAHADFTPDAGAQAARTLLSDDGLPMTRLGARPSALFVSSDYQAWGVLQVCDELGLSVPGDVALVSFDGTRAGTLCRPPLTSYRQPVEDIARLSVRHLLAAVAGDSAEPEHVVLPGNLVIGRSCGCGR